MKTSQLETQFPKKSIEDLVLYLKNLDYWEPADFFLHASILSFVRMSAGLRERENTALQAELLLLGAHSKLRERKSSSEVKSSRT